MKIEFVADAKAIYRRWSVQFSVLAAALLATMVDQREAVVAYLNSLPASFQPYVPFLIFVVSVGLPTLLVALRQPKLNPPKDDA